MDQTDYLASSNLKKYLVILKNKEQKRIKQLKSKNLAESNQI